MAIKKCLFYFLDNHICVQLHMFHFLPPKQSLRQWLSILIGCCGYFIDLACDLTYHCYLRPAISCLPGVLFIVYSVLSSPASLLFQVLDRVGRCVRVLIALFPIGGFPHISCQETVYTNQRRLCPLVVSWSLSVSLTATARPPPLFNKIWLERLLS